MKTIFDNSLVMWNESEILFREYLTKSIPHGLLMAWQKLNANVRMIRVETPILTPGYELYSHIAENFELMKVDNDNGYYLRPETTAGTYMAFKTMFPQRENAIKNMPICLWQIGKSFRDEKNPDTMRASKLRLREFYQMEFQLFLRDNTMAPYLESAAVTIAHLYGGTIIEATELPHYSEKTLDVMINDLEIAGCSMRKDFAYGKVCEIAIGIDRLVALRSRDNDT